jgi:hypothetical protein
MLSMTYLMLRSARRAHLEARTVLLQRFSAALIDFLTASKPGIYCAIGTGLRRCDEVDDTTAETQSVICGLCPDPLTG